MTDVNTTINVSNYVTNIVDDKVELPKIALKKAHLALITKVVSAFNETLKEKVSKSDILFNMFIRDGQIKIIGAHGEPHTLWDVFTLLGVANGGTMKGKLEEKVATLITARLEMTMGDDIRNTTKRFF